MKTRFGNVTILDGALGTELDRRGVDVSLPLWSARALTEAPEVIERIHRDYVDAGAEVITAATYRTQRRTLEKVDRGGEAKALTLRAVELARAATDGSKIHVAGSVAPLEDCYKPDDSPTYEVCFDEQRRHIENLLDAGVDSILIESMGTRREVIAALRAARELAPGRFRVAFLLRAHAAPGVLLNGSPVADVLEEIEGASAVGINCVAAPDLVDHLALLRALVPDDMPLMAYANTARPDLAGGFKPTAAQDAERYAELAIEWVQAGAKVIGGCCGTTPSTITAIRRRLLEPAG